MTRERSHEQSEDWGGERRYPCSEMRSGRCGNGSGMEAVGWEGVLGVLSIEGVIKPQEVIMQSSC